MGGRAKYFILASAGVCGLLAALLLLVSHRARRTPICLTAPHNIASTLIYLASSRHYFEDEQEHVSVSEVDYSSEGLSQVMAGTAELAVVSEAPLVRASFTSTNFRILATVFSTSSDVKIIARRDHGISRAQDLRGKKVGAPQGTGPEYYLASFLLQFGLGLEDVRLVNKSTAALVGELKSGKLDALAVSEANAPRAVKQLGREGIVLPEGSLYRESYNLVASRSWLKLHEHDAEELVEALVHAEEYFFSHRAQAEEAVGEWLHLDRAEVAEAAQGGQWALRLDQSLLVSLEEKARWMQERKLVPAGKIPNYLSLMSLRALGRVKPSGVSVIH